jgi:hypothetical protein
MKILNAIAITGISLSSIMVFGLQAQAQTPPTTPTQPQSPNQSPMSNDWKDFPAIEQGFMEGCVGKRLLSAAQGKIKNDFCQCAFLSYKNRYSPQVFMQINNIAVKIGQDGPALVSLMMNPELGTCSSRTGFKP